MPQVILRYFSAPVLAIVFSFAYPSFIAVRNDPLHIFAFTCAHIVVVFVLVVFIVPRMLNPLIPKTRREEGDRAYAPQVSSHPHIPISRPRHAKRLTNGRFCAVSTTFVSRRASRQLLAARAARRTATACRKARSTARSTTEREASGPNRRFDKGRDDPASLLRADHATGRTALLAWPGELVH